MSDPEPDAGQGDGRQEVSRQLAAARGDRAEALEPGEETPDRIALPAGAGSTERRSFRSLRVGMCGREPRTRTGSRMSRASQPRSATMSRAGGTLATGANLTGRPPAPTTTWILLPTPPREHPMAGSAPLFRPPVLAGANDRAVEEMEHLRRLGAQGIENVHPAPSLDQRL